MSRAPVDRTSPYVGPRSFGAGETLYGRDREAQALCDLLISERIVLLHSPSGAGKTSLVQARLLPMLAERDFTVLPVMRVSQEPPADLAPGANRYLLSLLLSLQRQLPAAQQLPVGALAGMSLGAMLATLPGQQDGQVLIFDQFEEILTVDPTNVAAKRELFAQVGAALRDRSRWALFVMREEYIAALEPYLRPVPTRLSCTFRLDLLGGEAAAQAIARPAEAHGVGFAPGAVAELVNDLRLVRVQHADGSVATVPGPYVEPVQLQVVCLRLWKTWARRHAAAPPDTPALIGAEDIAAMGDVGEALEAYYDECLAEVCADQQVAERSVRDWFDGQLITPRGLRNQVLKGQESTQGLANATIAALIDTYLVRAEQRRGLTWYELAHDRLVEPVVASNSAWRDRHLQQFQRQATLWQAQGRPDGLLLRGKALEAAEEWLRAGGEASPLEQVYLDQCSVARGRERQARLLRLTIWGLALLAFVVAIVAVNQAFAADRARQQAEAARDEASARQLAAQSEQVGAESPQQALLLALEAASVPGRAPLPEALGALYRALAATGGRPLRGSAATVEAVAFSPDGALLATAGDDGSVQIWPTADPAADPARLRGHAGAARAVAFSPDGSTLATAGDDGAVRLWPVGRPDAAPATLAGHGASVRALAFSPDGRLVAAGAADGGLLVWRAADPAAPPARLAGHSEAVNGLAFTPDGSRLISISDDLTARVWSVRDPAPPRTLAGHADAIQAMALSADGATLATGSRDGAVLVWRLDADDEPLALAGDLGSIRALALSPDGAQLAAGDSLGGALVWSLADAGADPTPLEGHITAVTALAFTPDGATLATASADGKLRLWAAGNLGLPPLALAGHEQGLTALAISRDGLSLATAAGDGSARLWPVARLSALGALRGAGALVAVGFGPDGRAAIVGDDQGRGLLWERAGGALAAPLHAEQGPQAVTAYSAGGRHLLTADFDNLVRWQPLDGSAPPATLYAGPDRVIDAALSADGRWAAAALELAEGGAVLVWETARPDAPLRLPAEAGLVGALALSADGGRLATGDFDGVVRLWGSADGAAGPTLRAHGADITALAFSPDGSLLASADSAGALYVWDAASGAARAALRTAGAAVALAIAPDNRHVAAGGGDAIALLWDLAAPAAAPVALRGHVDSILDLGFSPAGDLVSAGADGVARAWPAALDELRAAACATAGRNLSYDEWASAFGTRAYRKTCPELAVAPTLIDADIRFPSQAQLDVALATADQLVAAGYADEVPARAWGALCRAGGLADAAAAVLSACDRAIRLDPADGALYDWRALARARSGNRAGAAEDLGRYLAWAGAGRDPEAGAAREAWAAALAAGANPYDEAALQILRRAAW